MSLTHYAKYKAVKHIVLIVFINIICFCKAEAQTWKNPMTLDNEWTQYGMGDPYIFKYRGVFYLYPSTKNRDIGAKCWSSTNLVNWKYEGNITKDSTTLGAYAPEIMYWNGKFYMYSSPRGRGHYVYQSDSPTGPFVKATENYGKSIDGSVFIDDDGKWYFYHASDKGIQASAMSSPLTFGPSTATGAWMNNAWTEAPSVIKRNGIYHMEYTGNHISSSGYRIDYASSTSPNGNFKPHEDQNPIILSSEELAFKGLGHGTFFIGPDLDSYYLTYHNHVSRSGPVRQYNFDRLVWNGDKMKVLGPTNFPQEVPKLPDASDYFDRAAIGKAWAFPNGGEWRIVDNDRLSQNLTSEKKDDFRLAILSAVSGENFTAEFNFKELTTAGPGAKLGAVINYVDAKNYGIVAVSKDSKKLEINYLVNAKWGTTQLVNILPDLDFSKWQTMKIEKFGSHYKIFIHDLLIHETNRKAPKGKIGYFTNACQAEFAFIALSNQAQGSGIFNVRKPIPGAFDAVHYNSGGEGVAYHKTGTNISKLYIRNDNVKKVESELGGYAVDRIQAGEWLNYNVNVAATTGFNAQLVYSTSAANSRLQLLLDGKNISGIVTLAATGTKSGSVIIKDLKMTQGYHVLKVKGVSGSFGFYSLKFDKANNEAINVSDFDMGLTSNWKYTDGEWSLADGVLTATSTGKRLTGDYNWSDYTIEVDINYTTGSDAGLLFRARNPALGNAGNSAQAGIDFFQGYYVNIGEKQVNLSKHNYNITPLASSAESTFKPGVWYHLKVDVSGNTINIFVDDMDHAVLKYDDKMPFINGAVGIKANKTTAMFRNFKVKYK